MTLFELSGELRQLEEFLLDTEGELTDDEPGRALEAYFDQLTEEVDQKIESYCRLIQKLQYRSEAGRAEIKRISELAATDENAVGRLKERLKIFIEEHGKIRTPTVSLWVQNNGGLAPLIVPPEWQVHPEDIPNAFKKVTIEVDTTAVREAIEKAKQGERMPRGSEGVMLGERGTHLRIK